MNFCIIFFTILLTYVVATDHNRGSHHGSQSAGVAKSKRINPLAWFLSCFNCKPHPNEKETFTGETSQRGHSAKQQSPAPPPHHQSFLRKYYESLKDKLKRFWKGLPDQIGFEFVVELIEIKFKSIEKRLAKHINKSNATRKRRDLRDDHFDEVKGMFEKIKDTSETLQKEIKVMEEINPEILVKSSKDDFASPATETEQLLKSAITSLEPKTSSPDSKKSLVSVAPLLIQIMGMFNDLNQTNIDLKNQLDAVKKNNPSFVVETSHHSTTLQTGEASSPKATKENIVFNNPSTDTLQTTINNFKPGGGANKADQVFSVAELLGQMAGIDVDEVQERAQEYFIRGIDVTRFKIETCMKKQEQKIVESEDSRAKHAIAVALHAILHFADEVAKPIVILALIAAVAGCIVGVLSVPVIAPALLPIMQTMLGLITTLARQIFTEWAEHSKNKDAAVTA